MQFNKGKCEGDEALLGQEFQTSLSYLVDVKPKMWLPVRLVESRLSTEIKTNLSCIRDEAKRVISALRSLWHYLPGQIALHAHSTLLECNIFKVKFHNGRMIHPKHFLLWYTHSLPVCLRKSLAKGELLRMIDTGKRV